MDTLSFSTLKKVGYDGYILEHAPERVLQFGEGAFLRAFADCFIDLMNEKADFNGKVVIVQPRGGHPEVSERFDAQDGLYTLVLRGQANGEKVSDRRVISAVSRCIDPRRDWQAVLDAGCQPEIRFIISNTTEAGIAYDPVCRRDDAPPSAFPAKLLAVLLSRFERGLPGLWILPCELNDHNGDLLLKILRQYMTDWNVSEAFRRWFDREIRICSTLVDRIVTGFPAAEAETLCEAFGYRDELIDTAEVFGSWVIEAPQSIKDDLPFEKAGLPILVTDDHTPYKKRKVRILNGAHTAMVMGAYLAGKNIVRECMHDSVICAYMEKAIADEILPTLDLPAAELKAFAAAVKERFANPYIDHALLAISLNSAAKWRERVMPTAADYVSRFGTLPVCLTASFAMWAAFCRNASVRGEGCLIGRRGDDRYEVRDDPYVLDFFYAHREDSVGELMHALVHDDRLWGGVLAELTGFEETAAAALALAETAGTYALMAACLQ